MRGRIALLGVIALLLAGCGGSGSGSGKGAKPASGDYAGAMREVVTKLVPAWDAVAQATGDLETTNLPSAIEAVKTFQSSLSEATAGFSSISPPANVSHDHAGLIEVMQTYEQDVGRLVDDLSDGSASSETESTLEDISVDRGDVGDYLVSIADAGYDIGYSEGD